MTSLFSPKVVMRSVLKVLARKVHLQSSVVHSSRRTCCLKIIASNRQFLKPENFNFPELKHRNLSSQHQPEMDAEKLMKQYSNGEMNDRHSLLQRLASNHGVDHSELQRIAKTIHTSQEKGSGALLQTEHRLRQCLIPGYYQLFTQIGRLQGGIKFLVDLRADLLQLLAAHTNDENLKEFNTTLKELLSLWFSAGLLNLQRITWNSSCDMLQKISECEAVIPIRNWTDLKQRVGPYRRCFVFTHSSMPTEPMVILYCQLTHDISRNLQCIINNKKEIEGLEQEDPENVTTAIFYSISASQKGLQGIDLGNYLIKTAVKSLQSEFPKMHQFSSLSPIPGFKDWLLTEISASVKGGENIQELFTEHELKLIVGKTGIEGLVNIRKLLQANQWSKSSHMVLFFEQPLMRLCARYLYLEKRRGYALDPVANFHLRNGAVMWRLNWQADFSARGLTQSCSIMVNYRYFLEDTQTNSKQYQQTKAIPASDLVLDLVRKPQSTPANDETKSHL